MSSSSIRRPKRKQRAPPGCNESGNEQEKKERRLSAPILRVVVSKPSSLTLLDLPAEILRNTMSSYLCTASDRFALQSTNTLFRELSNSSKMLRNIKLLNIQAGDNDNNDNNENANANGAAGIIGAEDSVLSATDKLLPFAQAANLDSLLLLGMIGTYVEDDLETGLDLFQKGAKEGDNRAQYELANILARDRKNDGYAREAHILFESGRASGHVPSIYDDATSNMRWTWNHLEKCQHEQRAMQCLRPLLSRKLLPRRSSWAPRSCGNPLCIRTFYGRRIHRVRAWHFIKGYSAGWQQHRPQILACGLPSSYYHPENFDLVPPFLSCAACQAIDYCSKTCQRISWKTHKSVCQARQLL